MILSVSRRTDLPNYYSDWFINRLQEGYLYVRNPFNDRQVSHIDLSPEVVDGIVFWTKNPANMLKHLEKLQDYGYYFQFTLTGYGQDIEPNLPDKRSELIPTFKKLSEKIGKDNVIWRYDPILLTPRYTLSYHLKAFAEIAASLSGYTSQVVISFIDFYAKIKQKMSALGIEPLAPDQMLELAGKLAAIAKRHQLTITSCAEAIDLNAVGISHGSCIDKRLTEKMTGSKLSTQKDKNQRAECGCDESIDVGTYHTCPNGCKYCYANFTDKTVEERIKAYDVNSPILCGNLGPNDKITKRTVYSHRTT